MTIQLGRPARDKITGFTGIAILKTEFLAGNIQFELQPPVDKVGAVPSSQVFDHHQLQAVISVPSKLVNVVDAIAPPADTIIKLGEKVKDIVSGIEGIAIRRSTFINGCVYYSIQSPPTKADGTIIEHFLEWKRLERVSAGVIAKMAKLIKPTPAKSTKPPGGPAFRAPTRG